MRTDSSIAASEVSTTATADSGAAPERMPDIVCFSHLRWNFVFQRPQQILSRFARLARVFFFEEAIFHPGDTWELIIEEVAPGIQVATPHLPEHLSPGNCAEATRFLLTQLIHEHGLEDYIAWYYTPLALRFTRHLKAGLTVYDCMDELSAFSGASPELRLREPELLQRADLIFAGGQSLYEAKRRTRPNHTHLFPSSIDLNHFGEARQLLPDPADQAPLRRPRAGFFGVIDERMDLELLDALPQRLPEWEFIMVGPTAKISPDALPRHTNLHYLGQKPYADLPRYLANWDAAILPFARNAATRFISPTKTPEYLAGGRPVVSTPILDVVRPYGSQGLVAIADGVDAFATALQRALHQGNDPAWLRRVDAFLSLSSWDRTCRRMCLLIEEALARRNPAVLLVENRTR